jgi:hypothetical protein
MGIKGAAAITNITHVIIHTACHYLATAMKKSAAEIGALCVREHGRSRTLTETSAFDANSLPFSLHLVMDFGGMRPCHDGGTHLSLSLLSWTPGEQESLKKVATKTSVYYA